MHLNHPPAAAASATKSVVLPTHISFNGVDANVVGKAYRDGALSPEFNAAAKEFGDRAVWGILLSGGHNGPLFPDNGVGRYPSLAAVMHMAAADLRWSLHVCGEWALEIAQTGSTPPVVEFLLDHFRFEFVQLNVGSDIVRDGVIWPHCVANWAAARRTFGQPRVIVQSPSLMPERWPSRAGSSIVVLCDRSRGCGMRIRVPECPSAMEERSDLELAFAGGINAKNVRDVIAEINERFAGPLARGSTYSLDVESSLRNDANQFDVGKCRELFARVYDGVPHAARFPDATNVVEEAYGYAESINHI